MAIATNRPDGWPQATMVGYVNDVFMLYCFVARNSQKYANVLRDPLIRSKSKPSTGLHTDRFAGLKEQVPVWSPDWGSVGRFCQAILADAGKASLRASSSAFSQRALARPASAIHVMRFAFHLRYHVHFAPSRRTRSGDDRHARLLFGFLPRARNAWQL
jgi:hypothetical protein